MTKALVMFARFPGQSFLTDRPQEPPCWTCVGLANDLNFARSDARNHFEEDGAEALRVMEVGHDGETTIVLELRPVKDLPKGLEHPVEYLTVSG